MIASRRLRAGQRQRSVGQAMVEFAVVAPIIMALILNHAAREGARYAIVHGSRSTCPSGPPPPGESNPCDPAGDNVKLAVQTAADDLVSAGDLFVYDPVWTSRGSLDSPAPGDPSTGNNARGEYVTVFVDYDYEPILREILGSEMIPAITISTESTLVVNT